MSKSRQPLSLPKLVPSMLTLTALCAGMTSIQFAISERWEEAVLAIVIAAFIDGFDGAAARVLKATSKFGAELDSLSDFLSFGVAPATVIYLWILHDAGRVGWAAALVFAVAAALRLARFNSTQAEKEESGNTDFKGGYFTGVPSPTAAGLAIWPMIISFQLEAGRDSFFVTPLVIGAWVVFLAWMMISRVPTFSTKQVHLPQVFLIPALAAFAFFAALLISAPWPTLTLMGVVYLLSVPASIYFYSKTEQQQEG